MSQSSEIEVIGAQLYLIPVETRMPLKFGPETLTSVTCARTQLVVKTRSGRVANGWGETPLSVQWVWPSELSYQARHEDLIAFCRRLARAWPQLDARGHPLELGYEFQTQVLPDLLDRHNRSARDNLPPMPWLAALLCCSPFDIALHDAFGNALEKPIYQLYGAGLMNRDLSAFLAPADDSDVRFDGQFPCDYLGARRDRLVAWHLVGGLDPIEAEDLIGNEPDDGYPVLLKDWIKQDNLRCLKIKLKGTDLEWDEARIRRVGKVGLAHGVEWLTTDFNCTVTDPEYVNEILDRLSRDEPEIYQRILYVEQPFPYDLESYRIDVQSVGKRKPLFLDESAHDWRFVRLGRSLGWTGVALKTCKTQTGAILAACWAQAHGMDLMVQDLTNPMLAQIPHALLAAHLPTIMGVETNSMQFYPEASAPEAKIHPGLYRRRNGQIDLSTVSESGFGYRVDEIARPLPLAIEEAGQFG